MASTNGFDSSEFESASVSCSSLVIASSSCSVLLCPLLSSAELETSSDASSVASSSCSSLDGVIELPSLSPLLSPPPSPLPSVEPDDEPVDPPLLSSPALPSSSVQELISNHLQLWLTRSYLVTAEARILIRI